MAGGRTGRSFGATSPPWATSTVATSRSSTGRSGPGSMSATTGLTSPRPKGGPRYLRWAAWAFTLPGVLFQFCFGWFPILVAFLVAFQRYYVARPGEYAGLQNFRDVFADPLTPIAFGNTFYYAALAIGLTFVFP